jgi:hypothetical protein
MSPPAVTAAAPTVRTLAPGIHVVDRDLRFLGLEIGARMTVLETSDGLVLHSPVDIDPALLGPLGRVRGVLAPNKLHHLFVGPWASAGVPAWGAEGLAEKRADVAWAGEVGPGDAPFGDEIQLVPLACFPFSNEVAVLHRPSRTLVLTDLVFHFAPTAPWLTRAAMWCALAYPGVRASALERIGMRRDVARREIGELLALDFDRLVMAHGDVVETGGREALAGAYEWLGVR